MELLSFSIFLEKNDYFESKDVIIVCTDDAQTMLGSPSRFLALVKRKNPIVIGIYCMTNREALASKALPAPLHSHISALNTRLLHKLCENRY